MAQLGARFHGMEEVVSSNLTRSTKTFQTLTANHSNPDLQSESTWSPLASKLRFSTACGLTMMDAESWQ